MTGTKKDNGKCRFDLVPPILYTFDSLIYTMGADKYDDNNWAKGIHYSRLIGATFRHIFKRLLGQVTDPESGLPHLAHARWNLGALIFMDHYHNRYEKFNDLDNSPIVDPNFPEEGLMDECPWRDKQWYKQMIEAKQDAGSKP